MDDKANDAQSAISLHVAEFEVLMTRNTYWTTIQFSVAPAIAIYLTLLITAWESIKIVNPAAEVGIYQKHFLWLALLGAELFVLAGYNCVYEIYNNVRYVETLLRPEIDQLVASPRYWQYEKFLEKQRGIPFFIVECWATVGILVAEVIIAVEEVPWKWPDYLWFGATLLIAAFVVTQNLNVTKMRLRHFR